MVIDEKHLEGDAEMVEVDEKEEGEHNDDDDDEQQAANYEHDDGADDMANDDEEEPPAESSRQGAVYQQRHYYSTFERNMMTRVGRCKDRIIRIKSLVQHPLDMQAHGYF